MNPHEAQRTCCNRYHRCPTPFLVCVVRVRSWYESLSCWCWYAAWRNGWLSNDTRECPPRRSTEPLPLPPARCREAPQCGSVRISRSCCSGSVLSNVFTLAEADWSAGSRRACSAYSCTVCQLRAEGGGLMSGEKVPCGLLTVLTPGVNEGESAPTETRP